MCFKIANIWCSKAGYSNYTLAMIVRNYDKLSNAASIELDKSIIKEHNIEKRNLNKQAKRFNQLFEIKPNENIIK